MRIIAGKSDISTQDREANIRFSLACRAMYSDLVPKTRKFTELHLKIGSQLEKHHGAWIRC